MKVSHYFEWEKYITGGHVQSVDNQRAIMDRHDIAYTTEATLDADLLHLNNMGPKSVYYARKARDADVPVLVHTHQTAEDFRESFALSNVISKPMKPYLRYAYSLADHLVCPSEYNRRTIEEYSDAPKTVISNGFDPAKVEGFDDAGLRAEYLDRYELEPPVVFNVGHVIKRKGLAAFVETARRMPELDFVWFGYLNPTGGELDRLLKSRDTRRLVESAPDNCQFTGYVEDIRGAYAAGDVFFWPSKNENEGIALLEAMACGKPPVIRDISTYDWLDDETHCLKADDEAGFVDALDRLRDPDLRDRLGANAADESEAFELDAVGEDLVALYRRLV
ncbi:glycosyltransferase family 4 protein [Halorussus halobius]|uniref:glycosyltransferase family 4 protein n=1 Tax=Halorussus halobius TaxID=1710537 RepID=UPI0010931B13|nr:glycosyltransferase family 4 protein [Halorussus halobius]